MKNSFILLILLGFFLTVSCEKESVPNGTKKEQVEINGQTYDLEFLREKMSVITGIEKERLIYDPTDKSFTTAEYDYDFQLSDYIESILALN